MEKKTVTMRGLVTKDVMQSTIVVKVESYKTHKKYLKKYKSTKSYKVHDPENTYKVGDTVIFRPCRPISKDKKFIVIQ